MKEDWSWVNKVISNKKNSWSHYTSLKKLIHLFELKWKDHENKNLYETYVSYLKAKLKIQFHED
jgi:hypothetical protein